MFKTTQKILATLSAQTEINNLQREYGKLLEGQIEFLARHICRLENEINVIREMIPPKPLKPRYGARGKRGSDIKMF